MLFMKLFLTKDLSPEKIDKDLKNNDDSIASDFLNKTKGLYYRILLYAQDRIRNHIYSLTQKLLSKCECNDAKFSIDLAQ